MAGTMVLSLTGCDKNALKVVKTDPYSYQSNYRDLRIDGMHLSGEQFTDNIKTKKNGEELHNWVVGDVRALVVPVDFTDYPSSLFGNTEEESRESLRKIMFGGPEETEWYSLSEYYKSSSFGKCNVTGVVAPWFHTEIASTEVPTEKNDKGKTVPSTAYARQLAIKLQKYFRGNKIVGQDGKEYNLADFDANKDGLVDTLIMLYTPKITTTGELWWAFCSSVSGAYGKYTEDGKLEGMNRFFWASFNFLYEKGNGKYYTAEEIKNGTAKADAHTMTHEFGHCLSLPDYYVTDYNGDDYSGLGSLDMMDYNIGDHNAYSKMMYGWINPRRVQGKKGSVKVKLKSTTTTGDVIIIPAVDEWNNTLLDQYLMVEFLTPEGVAKKDGEEKYLGSYPLYYSKAGVRITHVDARMGVFTYSSNKYVFAGYTGSTKTELDNSYVSTAASNTATDSAFPAYKEIELLPATGQTMKSLHEKGDPASDDCLYIEGDSFGMNGKWENFKLNGTDGSQEKDFGFKIRVDKIKGNDYAQLTISL